MKQKKYVSSIGFKGIGVSNVKYIKNLLEKTVKNPDVNLIHVEKNGKSSIESFCYKHDSFGLEIFSSEDSETRKIIDWNVFALEENDHVYDTVKIIKEGKGYTAYCSEYGGESKIAIRLNRKMEYKKSKNLVREGDVRVNLAGLAEVGSIIFPIKKSDEMIQRKLAEEQQKQELISRIKNGDENAVVQMIENTLKIANSIQERLRTDDVLSVFDVYIMPHDCEKHIYAVLGEITKMEEMTIAETGQIVFSLVLMIGKLHLQVYINKLDLLGMPSVGMRFMGICEMQGFVK